MKTVRLAHVLSVVVLLSLSASGAEIKEKWVMYGANFMQDGSADALISVMRDAKAAGATNMYVDDPQFGFINDLPPKYLANVKRVRDEADKISIEIAPGCFPFGYSGGYLVQDLNLAAGIPVRNARFMVKNGAASPDSSSAPTIPNPGFDEADQNGPVGWTILAAAGKNMDLDKKTKHSGAASLAMYNLNALPAEAKGQCRVWQDLKVEPFQYYHLSMWIKSQGVRAEAEDYLVITSSGGKRRNCYTNLGVRPTQDWTLHEVTFNTLEGTSINLSIGVSDAGGGTIWFDDVKLEPAGLCNVLRSATKPFIVTSADGSVTYEEGKDFAPVADPNLGKGPESDSYYIHFPTFSWHQGPAIKLLPGSRIKDGDRLLVSFYHTHKVYNDQVLVAFEDPKVYELMDKQIRGLVKAFGTKSFYMRYDEIRIAGWEEQPGGAHLTPGQLLAANVSRGVQIIRKYAPDARIYVWSDMFTPLHNARKVDGPGYYLCNGDFYGAWEGLPRDVVIVNWGQGREGLAWFADRGCRQIISASGDGEPQQSVRSAVTASKGVPNVIGIMYTSWSKNYRGIGEFFKAVNAWPKE